MSNLCLNIIFKSLRRVRTIIKHGGLSKNLTGT